MRKLVVLLMSSFALVSLLFTGMSFYQERNQVKNGFGDFIIFYTGAQIIRDGNAQQLYNLDLQRAYQAKFDVPIRKGPLPYNHPPFELIWHLPLVHLDYVNAYLTWSAVNVILLTILFWLYAPWQYSNLAPMYLLLFIAFYPVTISFLHGQDSVLLAFLLGSAFFVLGRGYEKSAGVLVALALIKPQFAVPSILALLAGSYWTAAKTFFVTAFLLVLLSVLIIGPAGVKEYLQLLEMTDRLNYTIIPENMSNIRGLIYTLFHDQHSSFVFPMVGVATLALWGIVISVWHNSLPRSNDSFELKVALTLTLSILGSYHAYVHDLSLLIIPIALVTRRLLLQEQPWTINQCALMITFLFLWIPFPLTYGALLLANRFAWGCLLLIGLVILIAVEWRNLTQVTIGKPAAI